MFNGPMLFLAQAAAPTASAPANPAGDMIRTIIFAGVILVVLYSLTRRTQVNVGMQYVIKSWKSSDAPDQDGNYVEITGRRGGVISWLFSLLGIVSTVHLLVKENKIEFGQGSLAGFIERVIPVQSISSTLYGYYKPWKAAVVIIALGILMSAGIGSSGYGGAAVFVFFIGLIVGVAYYYLNKALIVGVIEESGVASVIAFKRSVIEGQTISELEGRHVSEIIQKLVDRKN